MLPALVLPIIAVDSSIVILWKSLGDMIIAARTKKGVAGATLAGARECVNPAH